MTFNYYSLISHGIVIFSKVNIFIYKVNIHLIILNTIQIKNCIFFAEKKRTETSYLKLDVINESIDEIVLQDSHFQSNKLLKRSEYLFCCRSYVRRSREHYVNFFPQTFSAYTEGLKVILLRILTLPEIFV